jgi:hypothetical protein
MNFATVLKRLQKLENPYPGLRPFEIRDAPFFFGRDQQTAELVGRLERNGFIAVVGVSGSGKSSLIGAGLIPALQRGGMIGSAARWRTIIARPAGAPYASLEQKLHEDGFDPTPLRKSSQGLIHLAKQMAAHENLLIVIDQFEEIFRYKDVELVTGQARRHREQASAEAREFVQMLLAASRHQPPVYVVITMRSDYLGDCAEFRGLPEALNESQYLIPRLTREHRAQAIECPLGGVKISPVLVQRMLNDAGDEPDQLPILQHALMRTWSQWHRSDLDRLREIQLQDYDAIGGFDNGIDVHANEVLRRTRSDFAATIFKRLTARGKNQERRDPARLSELWKLCGARTKQNEAEVTAVVDHFRGPASTFLLPCNGTLHPETYIDIAHESLIRQWRVLRDQWLPEETRSAKTFLDLVGRARNWKSRGGSLLAGLDLADAKQWNEGRNQTQAWAEHYADEEALGDVKDFIDASERREGTTVERAMERYQQELEIAGQIQQQLMTVTIPEVPYATVKAVSYPCSAVGGDLYDVIHTERGLAIVVADVAGKGVSAAVLASNLQGMLYSQLTRDYPLADVIASVNRFMCERVTFGKYATLLAAYLMPAGELEFLNAGHVAPLLISGTTVQTLQSDNMPVGLIADVKFHSDRIKLKPGDRLIAVSDGITEAMDAQEELFGHERLAEAAVKGFAEVERALRAFCGSTPLSDDSTLLELAYRG